MHYLTDGKQKYIWHTVTGEEQLFDLTADRRELHDLGGSPAQGAGAGVAAWRQRLIDLLGKRGDGFSDGAKLLGKSDWYGPFSDER